MKELTKRIYFLLRAGALRLLPRPAKGTLPEREDLRILVIRLDRLGDLILSTPVFRILRNSFPKAVIHALVTEANADLIGGDPNLNAVLTYKGFNPARAALRDRYDLVIDLINSHELKTALLTRSLNAPYSIGFDVKSRGVFFTDPVRPYAQRKHFVEFIPDILSPLGLSIEKGLEPRLYVKDAQIKAGASFLSLKGIETRDFVISIHPGGFYASQRWPREYFAGLIGMINAYRPKAKFLLLGSAIERRLIDDIFRSLEYTTANSTAVRGENGTGAVAALLSLSGLFIGNNSGLLHAAAALKVPTVSFMGPTVPWLWRPRGPAERNIVFRKELLCSPCNKGQCAEHSCMRSITPGEVFAALKPLLDRLMEEA